MSLHDVSFPVGIDRGSAEHAACVLDDATGREVAAITIGHTAAECAVLARRLEKAATPELVAVSLERSDGRLDGALLAAGQADTIRT